MDTDMHVDTHGIANGAPTVDVGSQIKTPHNTRLHQESRNLARMVNKLVEYQIAHPQIENPVSRGDIESSKKADIEIERKKKIIRAQLAVIKTLYRQSVMKVRDEKAQTAESRKVNDELILQLNNLKYEEQSLTREITATENYDHKYKKLSLIPIEDFLESAPELKDATEHEIMTARIEQEYQVRVKLEERRQEKLKQKQMLIAEVKKRKDDLEDLDKKLEAFIEAAEPIQKALATE